MDNKKIPKVSAQLKFADKLGIVKVRLGINRKNYQVAPGIYAVGNPGKDSNVFVTANYKLSFDMLRSNLKDFKAWILVLDTKGINVWCAAGKGTFGTNELISRIMSAGLKDIVDHRRLIVPQLGAAGVAGHVVKKVTGFQVIFGPVRASDIPAFLKNNMKASAEMRKVRFSLYDRMILVPMEVIIGAKYIIAAAFLFFVLSGLSKNGYSIFLAVETGKVPVINLLTAFFAGAVAGPVLLPWLPGRSFSLKGFFSGIIFFLLLMVMHGFININRIEAIAWMLLISTMSSFVLMNFTGASTYTSLSGVKKEMKTAVPLQIAGFFIGMILWITCRFI
ncbi:mercury methylation corrinoid protein HgcA [Elusimicrobiota bacterium]